MTTTIKRTLIAAFACSLLAVASSAAPTGKKYSKPELAVDEFIAAIRSNDVKSLVKIFGSGSERLFETGDAVQDENSRRDFLAKYDQKHVLASRSDGAQVLVVGNDSWPLPIPLVKSGSKWQFDTAAGMEEIINRRVGRNELDTIQTCLAIGDAQREYFRRDHDGDGVREYAQKFASTVNRHDGLFWAVKEGEPVSPLGELIAGAAAEGYEVGVNPYHGYRYRLLASQGSSAPGGAYEYLARDNQIGGFAVLAYPADYGDSGVMTFMVSHSGVVYQRDFGEKTQDEVKKIVSFDPGEGWAKVPDSDLQPLAE